MTGARDWRIISRHLLPHLSGPLIVWGTLVGAGVIVLRNFQARLSLEHEHARAAHFGRLHRAIMQAGRDPAPRAEIVTKQALLFGLPDRTRG